MKLINCYIENFGKLSNFRLDFRDGLNTVKEENGYGKTTLTVFIKAMFFGLDATKRSKLENNDRKHYMPWQGGRCGGSLTFSSGEKTYRIERTFMPKAADDIFALYDSKSGNISTDFSENLGEELFSIDVDGFERTVFLSEANLSGKNENKTISAKLSDLVGCDGDLGVMDEAIELLEKQRKIYYKRGGAGEIGELKEKLGSVEREISDLTRLKESFEEQKNNIVAMNRKLSQLRELKKENDEQKQKAAYLKQYLDMRSSLEKEKAAKESLALFFEKGFPTSDEIEAARESFARAKQIDSYKNERDPAKASSLSDFFKVDVKESEYANARQALAALSAKEAEKELLGRQISLTPQVPNSNISVKDIDTHISAVKKLKITQNTNKSYYIILPFAFFFMILGITLGLTLSPLAYGICVLSAVLFPLAFIAKRSADAALSNNQILDEARRVLTEFVPYHFSDDKIIELLYESRSTLIERERKCTELSALKERYNEILKEIAELERQACEFIAKFKSTGCATVREAVEYILKKKDIHTVLSKSNEAAEKKEREAAALAAEHKKSALAFLSRFPCSTDRPFDEISTKLAEYYAISRSVSRMENAVSEFALAHRIDESAENLSIGEIQDLSALDSEITELERTVAITERQCVLMNETLDTKDELEAEKEELAERISEYEIKLRVIQKTKVYLEEAKDILTSKYLSKTKSAFDKYIKLIANEAGDGFNMNTSFSVMKEERGSLKESEAYSRGTRDLYALATRLALIDSLYENESPFIILDDPFAYFDDEKLLGAVKVLKAIAKQKQILYLTCTKARVI